MVTQAIFIDKIFLSRKLRLNLDLKNIEYKCPFLRILCYIRKWLQFENNMVIEDEHKLGTIAHVLCVHLLGHADRVHATNG